MHLFISRPTMVFISVFLVFSMYGQKNHILFNHTDSEKSDSVSYNHADKVFSRTSIPLNTSSESARPEAVKSRLNTFVYSSDLSAGYEAEDSTILYWTEGKGQDDLAEELMTHDQFYPGYSWFFSQPDYVPPVDSLHMFLEGEKWMKLTADKDSENGITIYTYYYLEENEWFNAFQLTYTYHSNGKIATIISSIYEVDKWLENEKFVFEYNSDNNLLEEVQYKMKGGEFVPSESYVNDYDDERQLVLQTHAEWNEDSDNWDILYRAGAEYENANMVKEYTEDLISGTDEYNIDETLLHIYDSNEKYVGIEYYDGEDTLKASADFNYTGPNISEMVLYDVRDDSLDLTAHTIMTHNSYNQLTSSIFEFWDKSEEDWRIYDGHRFYYEEYETTTDSEDPEITINQADFTIFPNPADQEVTVAIDDGNIDVARIYDQSGKLVFVRESTSRTPELQINLDDISSGTYILEIESNRKKGVKTLVVQ